SDWFSVSWPPIFVRPSRCSLRSSNCRSAMRNASLMALCRSGVLVLAQQVVGLVADHEISATGNAEFDVHDRRDGAGEVLGALIDAPPARDQPVVKPFELGDPSADFLLRPLRTFDIMKGDFQRHLQLHILGVFWRSC